MNVLLIEAPYDYGHLTSCIEPHFPLGLGYIAAYMREKGYPVRLLLRPTPETLQQELGTFQPRVVGISCMTPTFPTALEICRTIKGNSGAVTVLGGPHVSALKREIIQAHPEVDFVVYGEGEETFWELCQAMEKGEGDFSQIEGLVYRQADGQIAITRARPLISDINVLPFPARDLVDLKRFGVHRYVSMGRMTATILTSRGCPFKCAFCASHITMGKGYRFRSAQNVLQEIDELVHNFGVRHLYFEDDTFTLLPERAYEILEKLIERNYDLTFNCLSRVDVMTEDLARLLRRAGCRMVSFGIESGNHTILKKIHKKISLAQAEKAVQACYRAGVRTQCTFILGFPYDTFETMQDTFRFALKLSPTLIIFFCLVPYPGTELFQYLPPEQLPQNPQEWRRFANFHTYAVSMLPGFTAQDLARLADNWHLRFYLRPRQLWRMLRTLHNPKEFYSFLLSGWGLFRQVAQNFLVPNPEPQCD